MNPDVTIRTGSANAGVAFVSQTPRTAPASTVWPIVGRILPILGRRSNVLRSVRIVPGPPARRRASTAPPWRCHNATRPAVCAKEQKMPTQLATSTAFEVHRGRLFGLAYRMLGSRAEAEDVVQDAYVRWHQTDKASVRNPEAW